MEIRDIIINALIKDETLKIQKELLKVIDEAIDFNHEILIGRRKSFGNINECKDNYNKLCNARRKIDCPLDEFLRLTEEDMDNLEISSYFKDMGLRKGVI